MAFLEAIIDISLLVMVTDFPSYRMLIRLVDGTI